MQAKLVGYTVQTLDGTVATFVGIGDDHVGRMFASIHTGGEFICVASGPAITDANLWLVDNR